MATQLDEAALAEVLRRAHEISGQTDLMLEPHPEVEEYVRAAEEAGIPREATLQALRERLSFPLEAFKVGDFVFAKSADNRYYVAKLLSLEGRQARVHFLTGSDHSCDAGDLRLFSLTPGQRLSYFSKKHSINVHGRLEKFDREAETVKVHSMGISEKLPLGQIRLPAEPSESNLKVPLWVVGVASALGGGVAGAILMRLLMR